MNRPQVRPRTRIAALATAAGLLIGLFPMAGSALAAVPPAVTPATGGGAISLDTTSAGGGTGQYTTLTGPVISENGTAVFGTGTIVLSAPAGFEFSTSSGSVGKTGDCVLGGLSMSTTSATVSITAQSSATACVITFSSLRVRPTGTAPTTGDITNTGSATGLPVGSYGALAAVPGGPVLTFTTQPSATATAGTAFPQQPIITSLDRFGNARVGDAITLTIRSGTGTTGAVLSCTPNPVTTIAGGVASFAGCSIDKSGTGYRLHASASTAQGSAAVDSNTITVNPGTPTQVGFATQPARGIPGTALASQPVVAIQDAFGNTVPTAPATTVTLSLTTNPTGATLSCTSGLTRGTVNGLATFSGCSLNKVGVGFKITAAAVGYPSAVSSAFDVSDRLAFTVQPSGAVGGVAFTVQPQVTVQAGASTTAANDNGTLVTLAIKAGTGASGAVLSCTGGLTKTAVAGVAAFTGCSIDKSSPTGNPYVLVATAPGLASAQSANLAVVAGPASKVLFTTQPANTNVNVAFTAAPVVAITDAGGNVVTTGADSVRTVTLAIGTNPGGGTLTCTGGLSKAAIAGVATFAGCSIDRAGVGYTLTATSTGLTSATSNAFNVTAPAAVISLVRSAGMVAYGQSVGFTIQFATNGAGRTFTIEHTYVGSAWTPIATLSTNAYGTGSFTFTPTRTGYYRVNFAGATDLSAAFSNVVLVGTRQTVNLFPTHSGVLTIVRGRTITFRSTVRPLRADLLPSQVTFRFYRKVGDSWVLRYERHVSTDAAGVARTAFRFGVGGYWYVRAFAPRTPYNSISRYTQREVFRVL